MHINLKTKIWLTICSIVLMFSFFTLYYFPRQQGNLLIDNYNTEVQNLANTVALGVKIAITEQNFEGVQTAIEFVKGDPRLQFVSMLQYDTTWDANHNKKNCF
jgi:two-component system NtrC family sensor kinase